MFDCLILETSLVRAKRLAAELSPEVPYNDFEYVNSVNDALEKLKQGRFRFCLVAEEFELKDLQALFNSAQEVQEQKDTGCLFVRIFEHSYEDDVESLSTGIHLRLCRTPTSIEKQILAKTISFYFEEEQGQKIPLLGEDLEQVEIVVEQDSTTDTSDRSLKAPRVFDESEFEKDEERVSAAEARLRDKLAALGTSNVAVFDGTFNPDEVSLQSEKVESTKSDSVSDSKDDAES